MRASDGPGVIDSRVRCAPLPVSMIIDDDDDDDDDDNDDNNDCIG